MLTDELIYEILKTSNEIEFANIIFTNKIQIQEWQNNQQIQEHFEKVKKTTREMMFSNESEVPREIKRYCMKKI